MTQDSQGRITVTGDSSNFGGAMLSARLTANGEPDTSFGSSGDGRVITPGYANNDNFTTCGAALTGGTTLTAAAGPIAMQLTSAGATRPSFGPGGLLKITEPSRPRHQRRAPLRLPARDLRRLGRRRPLPRAVQDPAAGIGPESSGGGTRTHNPRINSAMLCH